MIVQRGDGGGGGASQWADGRCLWSSTQIHPDHLSPLTVILRGHSENMRGDKKHTNVTTI